MKIIHKAVIAVLILTGCGTAHSQDARHVKIATEGAFPPWNFVTAAGEPAGFDIDVGRAVCERAKIDCVFVTQAWDGIIPALTVGKFDAIMAGMSITKKREEVIAFSEPYASTSNYFVTGPETHFPAMPEGLKVNLSAGDNLPELDVLKRNLKGAVIGVQGSTNAEAFVRQYLGETVAVRTYDTQDNLNLDLAAGRIDAGLADYSVWADFLKSEDGKSALLYGPRLSGGLFGPGIGIGIRKGDDALKTLFDGAIDAVQSDGTLRELSFKWFGADLVSN